MKQIMSPKRVYCAVLIALFLYGIWNDLRDIVLKSYFDTGIFLSLIGLIWAVQLFLHPEKLNWKIEGKGWLVSLCVICGLFCVVYLILGLSTGHPEKWKILCGVSGAVSVGSALILKRTD